MSGGERRQLMLVGVGGQGVLSAARVVGDALREAGLPAMVGQLHGMSQRGGPVETSVVMGPAESSFVLGAADWIAAFEPLELLRVSARIGPDTRVVVSDTSIVPFSVTGSGCTYPSLEEIVAECRRVAAEVRVLPGRALTAQVGEPRVLNIAMLGALAGLRALPIEQGALLQASERTLPRRFRDANREALELGHRWARDPEGRAINGAS